MWGAAAGVSVGVALLAALASANQPEGGRSYPVDWFFYDLGNANPNENGFVRADYTERTSLHYPRTEVPRQAPYWPRYQPPMYPPPMYPRSHSPHLPPVPPPVQAAIGNSCVHKGQNQPGTCKLMADCPAACKPGAVRQYCAPHHFAPVVCCPDEQVVSPNAAGNAGNGFTLPSWLFTNPSAQSGQSGQSDKSGMFGQSGQSGMFGQSDLSSIFGQPDQSGMLGQSGQSGMFSQSDQSSQSGQSARPNLTDPIDLRSSDKKPPLPPGKLAARMCLQYIEFVPPAILLSEDNECVPNHTYPVGGNPALAKEFPHMAQLGSGSDEGNIEWFCGGSLIAEDWVLTAAHCLFRGEKQVQWVKVGDLAVNVDDDDAYPQIIRVVQTIKHPDYNPPEVYNDIALLRLERAPNMTTGHVRPACLKLDRNFPTPKLVLTGWGLTEDNGKPADTLMEVRLKHTPPEPCAKYFAGALQDRILPRGLDTDGQICAGLGQIGKDACQGDSGGPLNFPINKMCMYHIAGITSFGQGCGEGAPGVYTRVSNYVPWIEKLVWGSSQ